MAVSDLGGYRSDHTISYVFGSTTFGKVAVVTIAKAVSTLGSSGAVPHPDTNRAPCRLIWRSNELRCIQRGMAVSVQDGYRSDHTVYFVSGGPPPQY